MCTSVGPAPLQAEAPRLRLVLVGAILVCILILRWWGSDILRRALVLPIILRRIVLRSVVLRRSLLGGGP